MKHVESTFHIFNLLSIVYLQLFLKKQPNYESEWLNKRERAQQQQKENEEAKLKKAKKEDDKTSKKRKKKRSV